MKQIKHIEYVLKVLQKLTSVLLTIMPVNSSNYLCHIAPLCKARLTFNSGFGHVDDANIP